MKRLELDREKEKKKVEYVFFLKKLIINIKMIGVNMKFLIRVTVLGWKIQ